MGTNPWSMSADDVVKSHGVTLAKGLTDRQELFYARLAAVTAIGIAGYLGIDPPGFVAQVVAFAFGLAAASLFPAILLGIFDKRMNREGAIAGMLAGLIFSLTYIAYFKFVSPQINNAEHWLFEISPEGIGTVGAIINFALALVISRCTGPVPEEVTIATGRVPRRSLSLSRPNWLGRAR